MQLIKAKVETCQVMDCSYNQDMECTAEKIEVGDDHPMCDWYTTSAPQSTGSNPAVAKCQVTQCHFNDSNDCSAKGITVMRHEGHADCATFRT